MEKAVLGLFQDQLRNEEICRRVTSIAQRVAKLKWAGHIARRVDRRLGPKVLEWRPRTGKLGASRSPTRWTSDKKAMSNSDVDCDTKIYRKYVNNK
ncbi:jg25671 [Pararge aegeria aegeria]|uniref:Jg25671 protein n=1 Tax=Pararge aegeria aegeria TaxID=348720 RepID=A0A8S4QY65_9NEOP|nr:jg25671 [Pararge aegeria aegeria]